MSRTTYVTAELHGYSLEEAKKLRRSYSTETGNNILTTVVILIEGNSFKPIVDFLAVCLITIYTYINH